MTLPLREIDARGLQALRKEVAALFSPVGFPPEPYVPDRCADVILAAAICAAEPPDRYEFPFWFHLVGAGGRNLTEIFRELPRMRWLEGDKSARAWDRDLHVAVGRQFFTFTTSQRRFPASRGFGVTSLQYLLRREWTRQQRQRRWNALHAWAGAELGAEYPKRFNFFAGHIAYSHSIFGVPDTWQRLPRGVVRTKVPAVRDTLGSLAGEIRRLADTEMERVEFGYRATSQIVSICDARILADPGADEVEWSWREAETLSLIRLARALALIRGSRKADPILDVDPLSRTAISKIPRPLARLILSLAWHGPLTTVQAVYAARLALADHWLLHHGNAGVLDYEAAFETESFRELVRQDSSFSLPAGLARALERADPRGKLIREGSAAMSEVTPWLRRAGRFR